MIHIKSLFFDLFGTNSHNQPNIIRLSSSNPVYLIFNNSAYPTCVVKEIDKENGEQLFNITNFLHSQAPNLIARPVAISEKNNVHYYIEEGLNGLPWFQLSQTINGFDEWASIRDVALNSLTSLQQATKINPHWHKNISPSQELLKVFNQCSIEEQELKNKLHEKVIVYGDLLAELGEIKSFNQHGDFCLNNLLFNKSDAKIIDFEDFGATYFPLFDEFTLALSLYSQTPTHLKTSIKLEISTCICQNIDEMLVEERHFPALFLYHLLFRIGKWSNNPKRDEFRQWLISILREFIKSPDKYF